MEIIVFDSTIKRFRIIGFVEGISYLVLLFIAMPIKYIGDNPLPVKIVGMTHGLLFVLFILALYAASREDKWEFKFSLYAFVASLLPFGTFVLDVSLKKKELKLVEEAI